MRDPITIIFTFNMSMIS